MSIIWYSWIWVNIHKSQLFGCLPGDCMDFHGVFTALSQGWWSINPPVGKWTPRSPRVPGVPAPALCCPPFSVMCCSPGAPWVHRISLDFSIAWTYPATWTGWFWLDFFLLEEYRPKVDYVDSSHSQVENKHPKKDPVLVDFSDSTVGFVNFFGI